MRDYQYIALLKVFFIYIIFLIPTWVSLFINKNFSDKKSFLKTNSVCIILEIIIFSILYIFPREIISVFAKESNVQNYMFYSFKILFIASYTTTIHYTIPIYMIKNKLKYAKMLPFFKLLYIPIMFLAYILFNTKGALFAVPICDLIYNLILICAYKKA